MSEILARISPSNGVELTVDGTELVTGIGSLPPFEAAYLARSMMAAAVALSGLNKPPSGTLAGDAHLPIMQWEIGTSNITGDPVLTLTIPPGIELTFAMTRQGAQELGRALMAQSDGKLPPEGRRGTVH